MSDLKFHAQRELEAYGAFGKKAYDGMVGEAVMALVDVFAGQGHSDVSAPMVVDLFRRVALYEPLCPLTGEDSEWNCISGTLFQNNRCSHVFKEDGAAYDIEGYVFRSPDGSCFTCAESRRPVEFPYAPRREYVYLRHADQDRAEALAEHIARRDK